MGSANQQQTSSGGSGGDKETLWPAWVYCTRYSDRPSSGKRFIYLLLVVYYMKTNQCQVPTLFYSYMMDVKFHKEVYNDMLITYS